jgi:hypothetical protein
MIGKPVYLFSIVFLLVSTLVSCGGQDRQTAGDLSPENVPALKASAPPVPALIPQFLSVTGIDGYPFTFRYWNNEAEDFIGDDPTVKTHYQGIHRVQGSNGISYLYLTRNGNPITRGTDYPGEILIVEMGSRNQTGEAFEVDFTGLLLDIRQPLVEDHTVKSIKLNGLEFPGVDWKHPGSGQVVGDRLFLPMEKTCNYVPSEGHCVGDEETRGAILVFNMSDPADSSVTPANPQLMCQIEKFQYENRDDAFANLPLIGTLGVTLEDGNYLFAHTTGGSYKKETALTFYELDETKLCTDQNLNHHPVVERLGHWNADYLQNLDGITIGEDEWRKEGTFFGVSKKLDWQMLNFVQDMNGDMYFIVTDKSASSKIAVHDDWAKLFKVLRTGDNFAIQFVAEKHLYLEEPTNIGSFDAVGGVYISPAGRLVLYSGGHDNDWPQFIFTELLPDQVLECDWDDRCRSLELGEFASNYFHPPALTVPGDMEADEGVLTSFNGCSFTDPLTDGQTWKVKVDWGDGTTENLTGTPGASLPLKHTYVEGPDVFTVTVTVTDTDGFSDSSSFEVTVNNLPPVVSIDTITDESGYLLGTDLPFTFPGRVLELSGSFIDSGQVDTHTGTVMWGDGTQSNLGGVTSPVHVQYFYSAPGNYTAAFIVTDDDGGSGSDSAAIRIVGIVEGLEEIIEILRPHTGNRHVSKAIGDLGGQNNGEASNGALDLLEKGNINAALVHIGHGVRELTAAQTKDPALEIDVPLYLLILAAKTLAGF